MQCITDRLYIRSKSKALALLQLCFSDFDFDCRQGPRLRPKPLAKFLYQITKNEELSLSLPPPHTTTDTRGETAHLISFLVVRKLLKVDGPSTIFFSLIRVHTNFQNNKNLYFQKCNAFLNSAVWPPDQTGHHHTSLGAAWVSVTFLKVQIFIVLEVSMDTDK